jgi:mRNA interferase MazF
MPLWWTSGSLPGSSGVTKPTPFSSLNHFTVPVAILSSGVSSTRDRVREHRARLRCQGLRPLQIWVPDVRAPEFIAEAHRQSVAIATSEGEADDQAFVDAISCGVESDDEEASSRFRAARSTRPRPEGPTPGTPRPVVVVQDDRFDATASVTVCPFTTNPVDAPLLRLPIEPSDDNGLGQPSRFMVDKVTTLPRSSLGARLGRLRDDELIQLHRSLIVFPGWLPPRGPKPRKCRNARGGRALPAALRPRRWPERPSTGHRGHQFGHQFESSRRTGGAPKSALRAGIELS